IVECEEADYEIIDSRDTKPVRSPLSSIASQVVKSVVYAALDWLSERRTSDRSLTNSGGEVLPAEPGGGRKSMAEGNFRPQRGRSDGRGIRRRKRRWR
ncbi:MAG: hypothetical protein P9M15_07020, partial [Candidatus Electryoneaceae bacterium]|nr:hypothetical protein [Candidatus Electryoneaceae bacterium]